MHLIRHGQGFHNVYGEADEEAYKSGKYTDAHLTELGWKQVREVLRLARTRSPHAVYQARPGCKLIAGHRASTYAASVHVS